MGLFTKDIKSMDDLFLHGLQDVYYVENQIVKSLPKMIEKATDRQLKQGLETHLGETRIQVERLEQVFAMYGEDAKATSCPGIDGILKEGDDMVGNVEDPKVLDAAIIAAAQAVEHYEITRYGTLCAWAQEMGRNDCARLLALTLKEEEATDKKLTAMAERRVNPTAERKGRRTPAKKAQAGPRRRTTASRTRKPTTSRSSARGKKATRRKTG